MTAPTAGGKVWPPIIGGAPAAPPRPFLPRREALDHLWAEVSARPLFGGGLRRYLALRSHLRLRFVDPAAAQVLGPAGKINDCRSCTDICCIGPRSTVLLRFTDIAALLDIGRADLISQAKPRFSNAELARHPALRRQVGSHGWELFPVLARNSMGACAALTLDGRCGIYPHWPLACARFPYALHSNLREVFYSRRCDAYWVRPDATVPVNEMAAAAVGAYNHRIRDGILLAYAPDELAALGLLDFLRLDSPAAP